MCDKKLQEHHRAIEINHRHIVNNAFQAALKSGRLSNSPVDDNYTGHYMYMGFSEMNGKDLFKNMITRQYDI